jgi:hypothetical protein
MTRGLTRATIVNNRVFHLVGSRNSIAYSIWFWLRIQWPPCAGQHTPSIVDHVMGQERGPDMGLNSEGSSSSYNQKVEQH